MDIKLSDNEVKTVKLDNSSDELQQMSLVDNIRISLDNEHTFREGCNKKQHIRSSSWTHRDGRDEIPIRKNGGKCITVVKSGSTTPETVDLSPTISKNILLSSSPFRTESDDGSATEPSYYQRRGRFLVWPVDQKIVRIRGQNF
jgi:hypothetical protein